MWESIKLFVKAIIKKAWVGIVFVFLDLFDLFDRFFKSLLPNMSMPKVFGWVLLVLIMFLAAFKAYHDLRKKRMAEFLEYAPEFKKDRIFREFYKLYKEGEFLKKSGTERRQKWDEEILQKITIYCTDTFRTNYLLATQRRICRVDDMKDIEPLNDENYESAISEIKQYLDNSFNLYTK